MWNPTRIGAQEGLGLKRWWIRVRGGGDSSREAEDKVFFDLLALSFGAINIWRMLERKFWGMKERESYRELGRELRQACV